MLSCHAAHQQSTKTFGHYPTGNIRFASQKNPHYKPTMDWLADMKEAAKSATHDLDSLVWEVDPHGMKVKGIMMLAGEEWAFVMEKDPRPPARYPCLWVSSKSKPEKYFGFAAGSYQAYWGKGVPFCFQDTLGLSPDKIEMRDRIDTIIERLRPRLPQFPASLTTPLS